MKKNTIAVLTAMALTALLIFSGCAGKTSSDEIQSATARSDSTEAATAQNVSAQPEEDAPADEAPVAPAGDKAEAVEVLKSIGMTVFDQDIEAPDFTLSDLDGVEHSLSDFRGKVVVLNFWATWCKPCQMEMPSMQGLYADLKDENFVILAVNQLEDKDVVKDFLQKQGYTFPVLMDDGRASSLYGVRGIPTTYIIGPDGNVIAGKVGTHIYDGEVYRDMFRKLM